MYISGNLLLSGMQSRQLSWSSHRTFSICLEEALLPSLLSLFSPPIIITFFSLTTSFSPLLSSLLTIIHTTYVSCYIVSPLWFLPKVGGFANRRDSFRSSLLPLVFLSSLPNLAALSKACIYRYSWIGASEYHS